MPDRRAGGSLGSVPRLPEAGAVLFVLWAIAMNDKFAGTLRKVKEVVEMITSISANLAGMFELLVVGVIGSPSPA